MGQGLQVWDALSNLIIDTNVSVLRDFAVATVSNTNTSTNSIAITAPSNATIITGAVITTSVNPDDVPPETTYDGSGNLQYKWGVGGSNRTAVIRALAY